MNCIGCGRKVKLGGGCWQAAVRAENGWEWATACTSCFWERAPHNNGTTGLRGPLLPGEIPRQNVTQPPGEAQRGRVTRRAAS